MIDMANRPFFRQHEPLPTPDKWDDSERRFAHKLEQLLDELYQLGLKLRRLLRGEKINDMGLSQNSYTDEEKEKLENVEIPVPVEKGGTGQTSVAAARNVFGLGNTTGALPVANGGTGATTADNALTNLGAAKTTYGDNGAKGYIWNSFGLTDQLFCVESVASPASSLAGKNVWLVLRTNGLNIWNATDRAEVWNISTPVSIGQGGTGATSANAALQNLGIAYKANETVTINNAQAAGHITGSTQTIEFTVYTPKFMNAVSTVTVTSLSACIRTTAGGYINGGSYRWDQYVGTSGYTVSATKVTNNAFRVSINKSSAFTGVTNNTPLAISYNITAKFS